MALLLKQSILKFKVCLSKSNLPVVFLKFYGFKHYIVMPMDCKIEYSLKIAF